MSTDQAIFGMDLPRLDLDVLMHTIPRKQWVNIEPQLYRGKWFDYRFMHPVQATCLYAHAYEQAYRAFYKRNIDRERAEHVKIFRGKIENWTEAKPAERSGFWRGRMVADALGMPYDVYLTYAFEAALAYWNRAHLPRPLQLYSDHVVEKVSERWEGHQDAFLLYSEHPTFLNENYIGLQVQNDHHDWIFSQVDRRASKPLLLGSLIWERELLPAEKVRTRYGDEIFASVEAKRSSFA